MLTTIGSQYHKTAAQVILRFLLQEGVVAIPKSANSERMKQNFEVFDFVLDDEDVDIINSMNTGEKTGADPDNFDF